MPIRNTAKNDDANDNNNTIDNDHDGQTDVDEL